MRLATDLIILLHTSLSIHLTVIDVSATGQKSLNCLMPYFLATDTIVHCVFKSNWKNLVKTGPSRSVHVFITQPHKPSGPGAFVVVNI